VNDAEISLDQTDEEALTEEVSDGALELAASGASMGGVPTLMHVSYCFTCPS